MDTNQTFDIFLVAPPGLEPVLFQEVKAAGFDKPRHIPGGVTIQGGWNDVWRANLQLRGVTRVLARVGSFRVFHLAQLDKRARKFPWSEILRPDVPVKVEVSCRKSKIYHAGAASQRIERAITEELGASVSADAMVRVMARIEDDLCTISVDTSGESLHKRGHKGAVGKAPIRETLAALFLRQAGYDGQEPVVDPMCGSGTFVIEAAEIAAGLFPGRSRRFAFEHLVSFDPDAWDRLREAAETQDRPFRFYGSDRDAGAIKSSQANAEQAGVTHLTEFTQNAVSDLIPPEGPPGLVMINPPYGARIGNKKLLYALYASLGKTLSDRFSGWRVGIVTSEAGLAKATALPFKPSGPLVPNGGIKVKLYATGPLR